MQPSPTLAHGSWPPGSSHSRDHFLRRPPAKDVARSSRSARLHGIAPAEGRPGQGMHARSPVRWAGADARSTVYRKTRAPRAAKAYTGGMEPGMRQSPRQAKQGESHVGRRMAPGKALAPDARASKKKRRENLWPGVPPPMGGPCVEDRNGLEAAERLRRPAQAPAGLAAAKPLWARRASRSMTLGSMRLKPLESHH